MKRRKTQFDAVVKAYPKFAGKWVATIDKTKTVSPIVSGAYIRPTTLTQPSPNPGSYSPGVAHKVVKQVYTGTQMIGIGVVHKSGLQPVFSKEQAVDLANMR